MSTTNTNNAAVLRGADRQPRYSIEDGAVVR